MKILLPILLCLGLIGCATTGTYQGASNETWADLFGQDASVIVPKFFKIPAPQYSLDSGGTFFSCRKGGRCAGVQLERTAIYFWKRKFYKVIYAAKGYDNWLVWEEYFLRQHGTDRNYAGTIGTYHYWKFIDFCTMLHYDEDTDEVVLSIWSPCIEDEMEKNKKK